MTRSTASIVIPVWNNWEMTRLCLDSLRPTMGLRDEVIVVDNGSEDATGRGLARYPWLRVVTNPENRGFAAACNQGIDAAGNDIVVFLNNDTLLTRGWLDSLLEPFADPTIGATGPRSNCVSGPQLVERVGYAGGRIPDLRRFAREWRDANRGGRREVERLVGFCLAVRAGALREVGGFDEGFGVGGYEDDDLCARLRDGGWRLLIADEAFVHHHGHQTFDANGLDWYAIQQQNEGHFVAKRREASMQAGPMLSACLIVKDEEAALPDCLASLGGLVDEVVVYDTGSTDATVELARRLGAVVVEGDWDDDFSRARNAALERCTGRWILHVDADERVLCDPEGVRRALAASAVDGFTVRIDNRLGRADAPRLAAHRALRLFRRDRGWWTGRIHEQVSARQGQPPLRSTDLAALTIEHLGYLDEVMANRRKVERNVRLAEADMAAGTADRHEALLNLGRSLAMAGDIDEALPRLDEAASPDAHPRVRRGALLSSSRALLAAGRPADALERARRLADAGERSGLVRFFEAAARHDLGEDDAALACLDAGVELASVDGFTYPDHEAPLVRARVLLALGRREEAGEALGTALAHEGSAEEAIPTLLRAARDEGVDLGAVVSRAPGQFLEVLARLLDQPAEDADRMGDQIWGRFPGDERLLAFATRLGPRLPVGRAMEWSARLRAAGLSEDCPLVTIARDTGRSAPERVRAAAIAAGAFGDDRATEAVALAAPVLRDDELPGALVELGELAPRLLPAFVAGATTGPARSLVVGRLLHRLGAEDEAVAVVVHGCRALAGAASGAAADEAARWLETIGRAADAQLLRAGVPA